MWQHSTGEYFQKLTCNAYINFWLLFSRTGVFDALISDASFGRFTARDRMEGIYYMDVGSCLVCVASLFPPCGRVP